MSQPTFSLGQTVITHTLDQLAQDCPQLRYFIRNAISRHVNCDWGDLCKEDKELNDLAFQQQDGNRLFSCYNIPASITEKCSNLPDGKIWIITYPGYNTTILLPSEY